MAYVQSGSGGTYYTGNSNRYFYARLEYGNSTSSATATSIPFSCKVRISGNYGVKSSWSGNVNSANQTTVSGTGSCSYNSTSTGGSEVEGRNIRTLASATYSWGRTCNDYTVGVNAYVYCTGGSGLSGWYQHGVTATGYFTIPARTKYTIEYNANGGTLAENTVSICAACGGNHKTYGYNCTLATAIPTRQLYAFVEWNTEPDGSGTSYSPGEIYSTNDNLTLYAQWKRVAVPLKIKVDNSWIDTIVRVKVDDEWVIPYVGYVKVDGVWHQIE